MIVPPAAAILVVKRSSALAAAGTMSVTSTLEMTLVSSCCAEGSSMGSSGETEQGWTDGTSAASTISGSISGADTCGSGAGVDSWNSGAKTCTIGFQNALSHACAVCVKDAGGRCSISC